MKIAVGSDERRSVTDAVVEELRRRGHELELHGHLAGEEMGWAEVAQQVAEAVGSGRCQQGVLFCWTGTGVTIAANKVPGVRAALCYDAETARGARRWNDANVLAMSLRLTSEVVAQEILEAWLSTGFDEGERANLERVKELDAHRQRPWEGPSRLPKDKAPPTARRTGCSPGWAGRRSRV